MTCLILGDRFALFFYLKFETSQQGIATADEEAASERNTVVFKLKVRCKRLSSQKCENDKGEPG